MRKIIIHVLTVILDNQLENAQTAEEYIAQFHLSGTWILVKYCLLQALLNKVNGKSIERKVLPSIL